ncbi:MAG TPA: hypothetical protein VGJ16_09415, partial [Pirellulales bacterium]
SYDAQSGRTAKFTPFAHWTGSSWQGGDKLPSEGTGWVLLHADGGHPGANPDLAAIRRWVAPADGSLTVRGSLSHGSPNGDGVRGHVVASSKGIVGEWIARNSAVETHVEPFAVKQGDMVDFITDCQQNETSDSFTWKVELSLATEGANPATFRSQEGFHGPVGEAAAVQLANVARAWQLAYLRVPSREELQVASEFLTRQQKYLRQRPQHTSAGHTAETQALVNLCQALLSSNEFLYVD